jgi:hypothetical protein
MSVIIDRTKIEEILSSIGKNLKSPASIIVVGSTASMLSGQDDRQTPDIDIWLPMSKFDATDLRHAVEQAGLKYDPRGEIASDDLYIQILRPGITMFPREFETQPLGTYGNLVVAMPPPALMVATKLARANESDLEDVAWWIKNAALSRKDIEKAISDIPQEHNREEARANMVFFPFDEDSNDFSP